MAAPHVSGLAALFVEKFKSAALFSTALLNTATPIADTEYQLAHPNLQGSFITPLVRQGAGAMNPSRVLSTQQYITPAKIELGKVSLHRGAHSVVLKVLNKKDIPVKFNLVHVPALSVLWENASHPVVTHTSSVDVKFESAMLEVPAHGSKTVKVTFHGEALPVSERLFYSGYIQLSPFESSLPQSHQKTDSSSTSTLYLDPDEDTALRVPYLGFSGDLSGVRMLENPRLRFDFHVQDNYHFLNSTQEDPLLPALSLRPSSLSRDTDSLSLLFSLSFPARAVNIHLVHANQPTKNLRLIETFEKEPVGPYEIDLPKDIPSGAYRLRVVALHASTFAPGYPESWTSPEFRIM
jgi:hypothetical protein